MSLTLIIENYQVLDGGAPASIQVPQSGLQVGRRSGMGWVLPDASRHISGHHFDVCFQDGGWWLRDVSTNGTFLQGSRHRLDGLCRLEHGTRFQVGPYVIVALLDARQMSHGMNPASLPSYGGAVFAQEDDDPWAVESGAGLVSVDPLPLSRPAQQPDFAQDFLAFPAPPPAAAPETPAAAPTPPTAGAAAILRAFCEGAQLPPDLASGVDPEDLARSLGQAIRAASTEIALALRIRALAQQFVRVGERSIPAVSDNNPLKFLPDPAEIIQAMFLHPRAGFLGGPAALEDALRDLRQHQTALFAALQPALMQLLGDLAPESVEAACDGTRFNGNRKSRAWEVFVQRWDAKTAPHENGILDEFITHFASAYRDALSQQEPSQG